MYERILELIKELHGDTSQTAKKTLEDLKGLRDELQILIDMMEEEEQ